MRFTVLFLMLVTVLAATSCGSDGGSSDEGGECPLGVIECDRDSDCTCPGEICHQACDSCEPHCALYCNYDKDCPGDRTCYASLNYCSP